MSRTPHTAVEAKADCLARFEDQGPGHINCAQTVLRFALMTTGSDETHVAIARQFGGGIAGAGETCGAVTGAALVISLLDAAKGDAADPAASRLLLQDLIDDFSSKFGGVRCRELTGFDFTAPGGHDAFVESGGMDLCLRLVGWMCDQLASVVASED